MAKANPKLNVIAIKRIYVKELFGRFNYDLPDINKEYSDLHKFMIFYGENGSGKTTLLQLIYHLLSIHPRRGHKSYISRIPFQRFEIEFTEGTKIIITRPNNSYTGNFTMSVKKNKKIIGEYTIKWEGGKDTVKDYGEEKNWLKIYEYLSNLGLTVYYLTDERKFLSDNIKSERIEDIRPEPYHIRRRSQKEEFVIRKRISQEKRTSIVNEAIKRAQDWLNRQVSEASSEAEININKIYADIVETFVNPSKVFENKSEILPNIEDVLHNIEKKSQKYSEFKIISPFYIQRIKKAFENATEEQRVMIWRVLKPHLDGIEVKLNSLKEIYNLLQTFTRELNNYYSNKIIKFEYMEGIEIKTNDIILTPRQLSSGEKQLLLLFCNTFAIQNKPCIFIIDEPEISLNGVWQRKLIKSLLGLTKNKQIQFIFATHCIPLLTKHKYNTVQLIQKQD